MARIGEYEGRPFGELGVVGGEIGLTREKGWEVVFPGEGERGHS